MTMIERPDELLRRSPWLIALQYSRENLQVVHGAEWMHFPIF
jgi:hypothetical protein